MSDAELLSSLEATLLRIQALTPADKAAWDADDLLQLAVERLWIAAGNAAEDFCKRAAVAAGVDPWAELYGFRSVLAHALPDEVSADRVWSASVGDLPRLLEQVRAVRA
ncbi:MAG: DUF86 domain-containing protein [Actinomycetota bacterium]|nr:DUF86 domain-containing protein [Actinomycetota bacterium]